VLRALPTLKGAETIKHEHNMLNENNYNMKFFI